MTKAKVRSKKSSKTTPPNATGHEAKLAEARALPPDVLLTRLRVTGHTSPDFFDTEVLVTLCREARESGNRSRYVELSAILAERLLKYAQRYVERKLYWKPEHEHIDLKQDLATKVWELLDDPSKAKSNAFAERRFGPYFKRRAIDFSRSLKGDENIKRKTRTLTEGDEGDDGQKPVPAALRDYESDPLALFELEESSALLDEAIDTVLTEDEREAVNLRFRLGLPVESDDKGVQTVCSQMGVTSRTVRNYLKSAYEKLKKELQK